MLPSSPPNFRPRFSDQSDLGMETRIWFLLLFSSSLALASSEDDDSLHHLTKRSFTFQMSKITKWTGTDNVVAFTLTVLASQVIVATGWLIVGKPNF